MRAPSAEAFFRVGRITVALRGPAGLVDPARRGPLGRFEVAEGPPHACVRVADLDGPAGEPGAPLFDSGALWKLHRRGDGFRILLSSPAAGDGPYRIADFSSDWSRGVIATRRRDPAPSPLEHPLHEILVNALLARQRGVELHGCGIIDGRGRGFVLAGSSGAGKTTSARLWLAEPGIEVLSDDRVIVRETGEGLRLFGTPWHGEARLASSASAPLAAVFLLEQARDNALVDLSPAAAVSRLFACAFPPFWDPAALSRTFDTLAGVVERVPVPLFRFRKEPSSVAFIRSALDFLAPARNREHLHGGVSDVQQASPLALPS